MVQGVLRTQYRDVRADTGQLGFVRSARMVVLVGIAWLVVARLIEMGSAWFGPAPVVVYPGPEFWEDARFYLGWAIGLALAPPPAVGRRGLA